MNLETQISPQLWQAIESSYQAGNYAHAVNDAMSFVTDVLRDKSGLDGDGPNLVRAALAFKQGNQPRIRINKLQTETEQDEQRGLHEVLAGMYTLVRNPRAHERRRDSQETANTLILFIDYLLAFLGESQQSFTTQDFVESVVDPHFVPDQEYVDGLVERIPFRKIGDALIALWRETNWGNHENSQLVIRAILANADDAMVDDFLAVVSDGLQKADQPSQVTLAISVLPADLWPRLSKMARLRAEHMLVQGLGHAWYNPVTENLDSPESTWISSISEHFLRKDALREAILENLLKADFDCHDFVAKYLFQCLPDIFETGPQRKRCIRALAASIRNGNEYVKNCVVNNLTAIPSEWTTGFLEELEDLTDPNNPEDYLPDGIPFLGKFVARSNPVEPPGSRARLNPEEPPGFTEESEIPF